jgi:hypothetical protein
MTYKSEYFDPLENEDLVFEKIKFLVIFLMTTEDIANHIIFIKNKLILLRDRITGQNTML